MDKASFDVVALIWNLLIYLLLVYTMLESLAFDDSRDKRKVLISWLY